MKRAFSLFTPLVGTAMIALAITLAVTMMQNDARIASGLTKSYEISGQELTAKLIVATAEASMMRSFETAANGNIGNLYIRDCTGISSDSCKSKIKADYESAITNNAKTLIITDIGEALHDALGEEFKANEVGMGNYISTHDDSISVKIGDGLDGLINIGEDGAGIFYVNFTDAYNKLQVSIRPHGFSYTYGYPVGEYINMTVDLLEAVSASDIASATYYEDLTNSAKNTDFGACTTGNRVLSNNGFIISKTATGTSNVSSINAEWIVSGGNMEISLSKSEADTATAAAVKSAKCKCNAGQLQCADPAA